MLARWSTLSSRVARVVVVRLAVEVGLEVFAPARDFRSQRGLTTPLRLVQAATAARHKQPQPLADRIPYSALLPLLAAAEVLITQTCLRLRLQQVVLVAAQQQATREPLETRQALPHRKATTVETALLT